ncbi:hypothetical protein BFW88_27700 [Pseudomonas fluorescens]|nr:hypothetical protein BFW88_27700 [Pseudomonas fluorescens]OPB03431.1 hypothetical protein BFW92_27620 [Pseudomonas fluorescens]OPB14181.1 hypothetical protein BFW93_27665 [Pseudomonas fluorescens]
MGIEQAIGRLAMGSLELARHRWRVYRWLRWCGRGDGNGEIMVSGLFGVGGRSVASKITGLMSGVVTGLSVKFPQLLS